MAESVPPTPNVDVDAEKGLQYRVIRPSFRWIEHVSPARNRAFFLDRRSY